MIIEAGIYSDSLPVQIAVLVEGTLKLSDSEGRVLKTAEVRPSFDEASGDKVELVDLGVLPEGEYFLECGEEKRRISVKKDPWQ